MFFWTNPHRQKLKVCEAAALKAYKLAYLRVLQKSLPLQGYDVEAVVNSAVQADAGDKRRLFEGFSWKFWTSNTEKGGCRTAALFRQLRVEAHQQNEVMAERERERTQLISAAG